jgi:hypothetical protein
MQTLVPPPGENAATAAPSIPRPTHFRRSTPPQAFGRHTSPRQQVWRRLRIRLCRPRPSLPKHTTPCAQQRRLRGLTIFSHHFAPCSIQLKLGVTINRKFSSQVKGDLDTHLRHEECKQRSETQTLPSADTQPYCSGVPNSGKRYQPRSVDRARRFELLEYAVDRKAAFA